MIYHGLYVVTVFDEVGPEIYGNSRSDRWNCLQESRVCKLSKFYLENELLSWESRNTVSLKQREIDLGNLFKIKDRSFQRLLSRKIHISQ